MTKFIINDKVIVHIDNPNRYILNYDPHKEEVFMNIASVTVMTVPPARINNLVPGEWGEAKPPLNIAIARAGIGTVDLQLIGEKGGYTADGRGYTYNSLTGFKKSGIDSLDMRSSPAERLIPTGVEHGQELDILV